MDHVAIIFVTVAHISLQDSIDKELPLNTMMTP